MQNNIKIIRPAIFSPHGNLKFGFSTRIGGVSPPPFDLNLSFKVGDDKERVIENRQRFFGKIGIPIERLAIPDQVHGTKILSVTSPGIYDSCDGLMTSVENIYLVVTVADCVPIFLFDPTLPAVAAVHAGWKGCKSNILKIALNEMSSKLGVNPSNLIAFIGPSASVCCYEVENQIAEQFDDVYVLHRSGKKPHLDMKAMQVDALLEGGVKMNKIEVSHYCTICNPALFHSYRRSGEQSGRMMGVIGFTKD